IAQGDRRGLGVFVAQDGDAVHRVRLVERVIAVAKAGGIDDGVAALAVVAAPAALVRAQAPAELRVGLIELGRAVAGRAQRELEDEQRAERGRGAERRALHGLAALTTYCAPSQRPSGELDRPPSARFSASETPACSSCSG